MDTGRKLKEARVEAGLTQEQTAEKLQVSRQTVSNGENNRSYPDLLNVIAMSDLYRVSLDTLLKGDVELTKHMQDSMDTVKQTRQLICAVGGNILVTLAAFLVMSVFIRKQ